MGETLFQSLQLYVCVCAVYGTQQNSATVFLSVSLTKHTKERNPTHSNFCAPNIAFYRFAYAIMLASIQRFLPTV